VQRAQIVSVAGSTATFDKALGTAASTCAGKLGGGLTTISAAVTLAVSLNSIHIKSGTYTFTTFQAVSSGFWLNFIGYGTTHNDGGTKPLITTSTNSINLFEITTAKCIFDNIKFTNTAGTRWAALALQTQDTAVMVVNCLFDGMGNAIYSGGADRPSYVINSEVKNSTGDGIYVKGRIYLYGSYIHDSTASGVVSTVNDNSIVAIEVTRSIITNNVDGVVATTNANVVINESVIANNSSDGINLTSPISLVINNSIIYGNNAYGITSSAAPWYLTQYNNAFGDNTSGNRNNVSTSTSDVTLTADPFTNAAAGNYGLNSTAGGGTAAKAAGFPGAFPGGTSTGFLDIGAVQTVGGSAPATLAYPTVN
jgi:hypothetical protein